LLLPDPLARLVLRITSPQSQCRVGPKSDFTAPVLALSQFLGSDMPEGRSDDVDAESCSGQNKSGAGHVFSETRPPE
jgi:hypothetical protein